jgi:hypothetical protein
MLKVTVVGSSVKKCEKVQLASEMVMLPVIISGLGEAQFTILTI